MPVDVDLNSFLKEIKFSLLAESMSKPDPVFIMINYNNTYLNQSTTDNKMLTPILRLFSLNKTAVTKSEFM